jgi:hypothetical protein
MMVQGCDCSIVVKTRYREVGLAYSEETIREAVSLLKEEAAFEGYGVCGALRVSCGVTGCVVTPLTIGTAPLLLALALGGVGLPLFVSESRNLYRHTLGLLPAGTGAVFDLVQQRGDVRRLFEGCRVHGFELRMRRGDGGSASAVKLRLDISGRRPAVEYPYQEMPKTDLGERFMSDGVRYEINGVECGDVYGLGIVSDKKERTKTEVKIHRVLQAQDVLPEIIEKIVITAQLCRERYESDQGPLRAYGLFRITLSRLVLMADDTAVDAADAVVGPLRYYCAGGVSAEVYSNSDEEIV